MCHFALVVHSLSGFPMTQGHNGYHNWENVEIATTYVLRFI